MTKKIKKTEKILAVILNYLACIPILLFFLILPFSHTYYTIFSVCVYLFIPFAYLCICKITGQEELLITPIAVVIVWSIFFYFLKKEGIINFVQILTLASFVYLFLFAVYYYGKSLLRHIEYNKSGTDAIPVKRIISISSGTFLVCLLGGIIVFFLVTKTDMITYFMAAGGYLMKIIIMGFIGMLQILSSLFSGNTKGRGELPAMESGELPIFEGSNVEHPILEVVVGVIMLYFFIKIVAKIIVAFRINSKKEEMIKENIGYLKKENVKTKKRKRQKLFFAANNNEKIRKVYYKILYKKQSIYAGKMTPLELETLFLKEEEKAAALQLAVLYEKARYSEYSCSKQDVINAKGAAALLEKSS